MRVDASAQAAATQAVRQAADATGVDFSMLLETAKRESGLNASARAGSSSASGLFQFVDSTWMNLIARYGAKYGLSVNAADPAQRQSILALRFDPKMSALMAGELTRENAAALQTRLGRDVSAGELYAAHVLGPAKAAAMIEAAQSGAGGAAAALDPRAARANPAIFYNSDGSPRSAGEVLAKLELAPQPAAAPARLETVTTASVNVAPANIATLMNIAQPHDWNAAGALWAFALRAYLREPD